MVKLYEAEIKVIIRVEAKDGFEADKEILNIARAIRNNLPVGASFAKRIAPVKRV